MKKQLEDKLFNDFTDLYKGRFRGFQENLMGFGFECGDGWFDLIYQLSQNIVNIDPTVEAVQVKEKFGGLRFYITGGSEEIHNLIDAAEDLSFETCEDCGTKENVTVNKVGWIATLCDKCRSKERE